MELTLEYMRDILGQAFKAGLNATGDLEEQVVNDLLSKFGNWQWYRLWTSEELFGLPEGSILIHAIRGRCWRVDIGDSKKLQFTSGLLVDSKSQEEYSKPMMLLFRASPSKRNKDDDGYLMPRRPRT